MKLQQKWPWKRVNESLKREANKLVLRGSGITCAKDFVKKNENKRSKNLGSTQSKN